MRYLFSKWKVPEVVGLLYPFQSLFIANQLSNSVKTLPFSSLNEPLFSCLGPASEEGTWDNHGDPKKTEWNGPQHCCSKGRTEGVPGQHLVMCDHESAWTRSDGELCCLQRTCSALLLGGGSMLPEGATGLLVFTEGWAALKMWLSEWYLEREWIVSEEAV